MRRSSAESHRSAAPRWLLARGRRSVKAAGRGPVAPRVCRGLTVFIDSICSKSLRSPRPNSIWLPLAPVANLLALNQIKGGEGSSLRVSSRPVTEKLIKTHQLITDKED